MTTAIDYGPMWHWIEERERIREKKERGDAPPWTQDPILSAYRFCNVRREDDRGTIWIRQHVREPFADHPLLWLMLCICRQVNWPDSIAELIEAEAWPSSDGFDPARITHVLQARKDRGDKVYTGAYMISAPSTKGANKQAYIAESVIGDLWNRRSVFEDLQWSSMQDVHARIMGSNGWGPFMAYQAVVDMRFTRLLCDAPDRSNWAAAGPGTLRGLNRLHGRSVCFPLRQKQALDEMRAIYDIVQNSTDFEMDFSDVPNILCETDKYLRVKTGQGRPRAMYVPGRGS